MLEAAEARAAGPIVAGGERAAWRLLALGLLASDAAALALAFVLAYLGRFATVLPPAALPRHLLSFYWWVALWSVPLWLGIFAFYRLYDRRSLFSGFEVYGRVASACALGALAMVVVSVREPGLDVSRGWLVLTWLCSTLLVGGGRFAARRLVRQLRHRGTLVTPTVVVGANEEGQAIAEQLRSDPGSGVRVLGFVESAGRSPVRALGDVPVLGSLSDLEAIAASQGVRQAIVASTALSREELLDLYRRFGQDDRLELRLSSGLFEILTTGVRVEEVSGVALLAPERVRITGVEAALKTGLDYLVAAVALVVLSPLLLLIAVLVRLDSPGPALHRRRVLGRGGKPFDAFKFRTMIVDAERRRAQVPIDFPDRRRPGKSPHDPRVTRVGRWLRRASLDELPQLWNVLRGEMSLVGPRMIAPEEARHYGKWQLNLLTVKPGITGPWQVQGRGDIPYEERVRLSMDYVRNYSIWRDLGLLLRTVPAVLRGRGAY